MRTKIPHLSPGAANILIAASFGPQPASDFVGAAAWRLAELELVDVIGGKVVITVAGRAVAARVCELEAARA